MVLKDDPPTSFSFWKNALSRMRRLFSGERTDENPSPKIEKRVVSVSRHAERNTHVIEIDFSSSIILEFLRTNARRVTFSALALVLVVSLCASLIPRASGDITKADMYASTCLGSWQSPALASGIPDVAPDASDFTRDNSAYASESGLDVYCGNFQGDTPSDAAPKKFTLKFSWLVTANAVTPTDTIPAPAAEPAPTDTMVPAASQDAPSSDPVSFLGRIFSVAKADDVPDASSDSASQVVTVPADNLLDVRYSIDGTEWKELGTVNADNWKDASFDINDPAVTSWEDLSKLQVSVRTLPINGMPPAVYLDSAYVEVVYETTPEIVSSPQVPTVALADSSNIDVVTGDTDFASSDTPTFVVYDPELTTSDVRNLVADKKAEVVLDPSRVLKGARSADAPAPESQTPADTAPVGNGTDPAPAAPPAPIAPPLPSSDASSASSSSDLLTPAIGPNSVVPSDAQSILDDSVVSHLSDTIQNSVDSVFGSTPAPAPSVPAPAPEAPTTAPDTAAPASDASSGIVSFLKNIFSVPQAFAQTAGSRIADAVVLDTSGKLTDIGVTLATVTVDGVDHQEVRLQKPSEHFKPGRYTLKVTLDTPEVSIVTEQDFTWGVLTMNTDRSIYKKGMDTYLQMGVLTDQGHTICDASLDLAIKSPSGAISHFRTSDGSVVKAPECGPDNVISVPDYYAHYHIPNETGTYQLLLVATTAAGSHTIHDSFNVASPLGFDVQRVAPTRIYPVASYPVQLRVKPTAAFHGTVVETVPAGFGITAPTDGSLSYSSLATVGDTETISWNVDIPAGGEATLGYEFDAPNISPEVYLLGPARFYAEGVDPASGAMPEFQEARTWQIASDAVCTASVTGDWETAATWGSTCNSGGTGYPGASDAVTINSGVVVTVSHADAAASVEILNPTGGANGITINTGKSLTISGALTLDANTSANNETVTLVTTGALTTGTTTINANTSTGTASIVTGSGTFTSTGLISIAGGGAGTGQSSITANGGTITAGAGVTFSGTASNAKITMASTATFQLTGTLSSGGTITAGSSTFEIIGAATVNGAYSFSNVTIDLGADLTLGANMNVSGNWTNNSSAPAVPVTFSGLTAGSSTVTLNPSTAKLLQGDAGTAFNNLTITTSSTVTQTTSCTVAGNFVISAATVNNASFIQSAADLAISGSATFNSPNANSKTSFWKLNDGTATVGGTTTIGGSTTGDGTRVASLLITTGTLNLGNLTFGSSTNVAEKVIDLSGGAGALKISGTVTNANLATFTPGTTSTVVYNGSSAQTIPMPGAGGYANLQILNTNASGASLGAAVTSSNVTGNLTVGDGTTAAVFDNGGFAIAGAGTATFENKNNATFVMSGTSTYPTGFGTFTYGASSTTNYKQTGSLTVTAPSGGYGNLSFQNPSGTPTFTMPASTLTVAGNLTIGDGTHTTTVAANGSNGISVGGNWLVNASGTYTKSTETVTFNSTTTGKTITSGGSSFNNVTFNGLGGGWTATTNALTIGGALTVTNGNFDMGAVANTVTGATSVSSTLTFSSATGTKTFTGDVTINGGGTWNETADATVSFGGNLSNSGTFTAYSSSPTGVHTFTGAGKSITGTVAIPRLSVSVSVTNNNTLTVSTALSGAGTLTQATGATLNIGGTSGITGLNASTNTNTVNYSGGSQTVNDPSAGTAHTYSTLQLSGSGTKTMTGVTAVLADFTMSGSASATTVITSIGGNASTSGTASWTNGAANTITGSLSVGSGSTVTMGNFQFIVAGSSANTISGTFTTVGPSCAPTCTGTRRFVGQVNVGSAATWDLSAQGTGITFRGGLSVVSGASFTSGAGTYTFNTNSQNIGGTASYTITALANSVGTGNTLTFTGASPTVTTLTQGANSTLEFSGTVPTITTLDATTNTPNTVLYSGLSQAVKPATYYNLTLTGATPSLSGTTMVNNTMTVTGVTATNNGTLTATGSLTGTGALTQGAGSTLNVAGTFDIATVNATGSANTIVYTGSGQTVRNIAYSSMTVNGSGTTSLAGTLTANAALTITAGTLDTANNTINAANIILNGGTFSPGSSSINLSGTSGTLYAKSSGTLSANTSTVTLTGTSGTPTVASGSPSFYNLTVSGLGATFTLGEALAASHTLAVTAGTLDASGSSWAIAAPALTLSGGTLKPRASTITLSGTGTVFNYLSGTYDSTGGPATIKLTDSSASGKTFAGGGQSYGNLYFSPAGAAGSFTITGSNSFADLKDDGLAAHSILFAVGSSQTVTTWHVSGNSGQPISLNSTDSSSTYALAKAGGGIISADYLTIQHSVATPATTWYAGTHSTDNQSVSVAGSGWTFTNPPCTAALSGSWSLGGNWIGTCSGVGGKPGTGDAVLIPAGIIMTMDENSASLGTLTINGLLNTLSVATSYTLTASNISIGTVGTLTANASSIFVTGTSGTLFALATGGTFTAGTSTVNLTGTSGTATVASGGPSFYNFTVNGSGSTFSQGEKLIAGNMLTVRSGTLATANNIVNAGTILVNGGTFTPGSSNIKITGTSGTLYTFTGGTISPNSAPVELSGNGAATVANGTGTPIPFFTLTVSGTGTKSLGEDLTVSGALSVSAGTLDTTSGGHYAVSAGNIVLSGTGTLTTNSSTIALTAGASTTLISVSGSGTLTANTSPVTVSSASGTPTFSSGFSGFSFTSVTAAGASTLSLGENLTAGTLTVSGATLSPGAATITLTGTGTAYNFVSGGYTAGTEIIEFTDSSSSTKTFAGGGNTYHNLWYAPGAGTGTMIIAGSNTFADLKDDGTAAHSLLFTTGTTTTVTTFNVSGHSGALITIGSALAGSPDTGTHTLAKAGGGTISSNYLDIQHSVATPSSTWDAGTTSVNHQSVSSAGSGWTFGSVVVSVTVTANGTITYGMLSAGASEDTTVSGLNTTPVVQNDGSGPEDFTIQGADTPECPWTLVSSTPGAGQYKHQFSTNAGSSYTSLSTTPQTLVTNIAPSASENVDLKITVPSAPTFTTACMGSQTANVTIVASPH